MLWLRIALLNTGRDQIHKRFKGKEKKNIGYDTLVLLSIIEGLI